MQGTVMTKYKYVAIFFTLSLIFAPGFSLAEDKHVTLCSYEWPPHHGKALKNQGYTAEIIKQIFEPQGYKIKKDFYPWKRAQKYATEGKVCNGITEIYFNNKRLESYWFGAPYSAHEVYLFALKDHPAKDFKDLRELSKYTIGFNRGGKFTKEFDTADYLKKKETNGYENGLKLLSKKRIDFFVSARSVALFEAQKLGIENDIHTVGKPLKRAYVHMAFSKKDPQNLVRLQHYNEGLFLLHKNGQFKKIMNSYGF
jgi:polar amino acid transport system substrate-binding protein